MDTYLALWILEFLLRQPIDDRIVNHFISRFPIHKEDYFLMKALLLRRICSELRKGLISDKILELLELIEELDYRKGVRILDSMREAYCAVAVDCVVKVLRKNPDNCCDYYNEILRIWRGRFDDMGKCEGVGLVSDRLMEYRNEIEEALWNVDVRRALLTKDTRNDAFKLVKDFVAEAMKDMGPTFLELAVEKGKEVGAAAVNGSIADRVGERRVCSSNSPREDLDYNPENVTGGNGCRMDLAVEKGKEVQVPVNTSVGDQVGERHACSSDSPRKDLDGNSRDVIEDNGCMMDLDDNHENAIEGNGCKMILAVEKENKVRDPVNVSVADQDGEKGKEVQDPVNASSSDQVGERHACSSDSGNIIKDNGCIMCLDASSKDNPNAEAMKYGPVSTPEVIKVQEALKSSCLDLHAAVKDPLPDALRMAESISCDMAREEMDPVHPSKSRNAADVNGCNVPGSKGAEAANAKEGDTRIQDGAAQARPSLMQRNSTARTFEWDDESIEFSSEELPNRPHLPTPKNRTATPLMMRQVARETTENGRRRKRKWSALEEQTLIDAVREHGRGNWKRILDSYQEIFEERTVVDLKDKWRNMTK